MRRTYAAAAAPRHQGTFPGLGARRQGSSPGINGCWPGFAAAAGPRWLSEPQQPKRKELPCSAFSKLVPALVAGVVGVLAAAPGAIAAPPAPQELNPPPPDF